VTRKDIATWQALPLHERFRDCFAEIEVAAEEIVDMAAQHPEEVVREIAEIAEMMQRVARMIRRRIDAAAGD